MITSWIFHAVVVSGLVAAAALAVERVLSDHRFPTRWTWVVSIWVGMLLPFVANVVPVSRAAPSGESGFSLPDWLAALPARVSELPAAPIPVALNEPMKGFWIGASAILLILLMGAAIRLGGLRRGWGVRRVLGVMVRVSRTFGPAVLGFRKPEIVLPRRLLEMEREDLHLVILHEEEHLAARDTLLLAACAIPAVLMPWNPAIWWQLRRLRLAVEIDCDRRVLARGVHRRRYGALLLRMGADSQTFLLPVAALSEAPGTELGRRLESMFNRVRLSSTGTMVALVCALCAVSLGFLAACDSPSFTGVEEEEAQATYTAESPDPEGRVHLRNRTSVNVNVRIYVNGELLPSQEDLKSLDPDRIESISVLKGEAAIAIDPEAVEGLIRIIYNEDEEHESSGFVLDRTVPLSSPIEGVTLSFSPAVPLDQSLDKATYSFSEKIGSS
jgi:hypothetical protein